MALCKPIPPAKSRILTLSELGGAAAFAASAEFGGVTSPNPLKLNYKDANGNLIQAAVQQIVQIKDLSDMVLMDFIMSQADRFSGNMHCKKIYIWIEDGVLKQESKKSDPAKAAEQLKQVPAWGGSNYSYDYEGQRCWPNQRKLSQDIPSAGKGRSHGS